MFQDERAGEETHVWFTENNKGGLTRCEQTETNDCNLPAVDLLQFCWKAVSELVLSMNKHLIYIVCTVG